MDEDRDCEWRSGGMAQEWIERRHGGTDWWRALHRSHRGVAWEPGSGLPAAGRELAATCDRRFAGGRAYDCDGGFERRRQRRHHRGISWRETQRVRLLCGRRAWRAMVEER